jgi:FKBP-type peptidyl-prolyl cis-trans isomerase FkpA
MWWNQWRVVRALDIAVRMSSSPRALHRLVIAVVLPLLAAPLPVSGATVRKVKPRASVPEPVKASNAIIALPLTPVVPTGQRLCSARTPAGLGYTMLRPGSGAKPTQGDVSLVNYIGYLATTGAVFDQGMRSPLPVDGVIPGFSQGLQMLAKSGSVSPRPWAMGPKHRARSLPTPTSCSRSSWWTSKRPRRWRA